MAKKCLGIREDTGDQCQRSASRDSDFCFMHQSQEGNQRIQHLDDDVYYCPQDGEKLFYNPKKDYHRCKECRGFICSAKKMDSVDSNYVRKFSQLNQIEHEEKCCSCLEGADLSIHEIEYTYDASALRHITLWRYAVSRIWNCNNCGSAWFEGTGEVSRGHRHRVLHFWEVLLADQPGGPTWLEYQAILR